MEHCFSQSAVFQLIVKKNVNGESALTEIERQVYHALLTSCDLELLGELGPHTGTKPSTPVVKFVITSCVGQRV